MSRRRAGTPSVLRASGLAAVLLIVAAACGGGGGDEAASTDGSAPTSSEGDHSEGEGDHGGDESVAPGEESAAAGDDHGDDHGGSGPEMVTITKEQFDELRMQVLELAVEVDQLQVAAGLSTTGETLAPTTTEAAADEVEAASWDYGDPDAWGELDEAYRTCGTGTAQSPIDLSGAVGLDLPNAVMAYAPSDATILESAHGIRVTVPDAGTLTLDGTVYDFAQLHVHAPSEHTVDGVHWPMEWHLVHESADGSIAVVAVLVEEGAPQPVADVLITSFPSRRDVDDIVYGEVDVTAFLPQLTAAYLYDGSLTTPPCTEGVQWAVLQGTITMSAEQIEAFTSRLDGPNNRPTQPLGDRELQQDLSA